MRTLCGFIPRKTARRLVLTVAVALVTLTAAAPDAWARAPQPTADQRDRGLLFVAALGMDGCTGRQCWNTYPTVYTRVHVMFRVLRYLAAGVHTAFNFLAPDFPVGTGRVEFWDMLVGPEVRGLLPVKQFDIWAGFAFGFARSNRFIDSDGHEIEAVANGPGLAWGLGLDYYLLEGTWGKLAVGADVWFYKLFPLALCTKVGRNPQHCARDNIADQFGVTYAAGATLTWFYSL